MRHEVQQRDKIHVKLEAVFGGTPETGLSPSVTLKRVADGYYWNGTSFQLAVTSVVVPEVDATNLPGYYRLNVPSTALDPVLGAQGYEAAVVAVVSPTLTIRENLYIEPSDSVSTDSIVPEGVPTATVQSTSEKVQAGTMHQVVLALATNPLANGKAGAFELAEAYLTVDGGATDLVSAGLTMPQMIELGRPDKANPQEASVTLAPLFTAGGGPGGEDVYTITIDSSMSLAAGDFVRGKDKPAGQGHIHEILLVPNTTTVIVHAASGSFDIVNGDTIERVDPSGIYEGFFELDVDQYLNGGTPSGQLRVVVSTVTTGNAPTFAADSQVVWTRALELDLAGRGFRAG